MFGQENDLADVVGVVGQLAIDGLDHCVIFLTNLNGAHQI
jgi:hypothetical protein